ncbi:unnamed protein product [Ostreobium quekettii]|uniref:Ion transport domain-containing protein n=1 Tax=Ostreobium quekettii TaxID=121088 RepID=A0A8S1JB85_9CHLO|nr:unnamed protein product [Ostreobium quekettii]
MRPYLVDLWTVVNVALVIAMSYKLFSFALAEQDLGDVQLQSRCIEHKEMLRIVGNRRLEQRFWSGKDLDRANWYFLELLTYAAMVFSLASFYSDSIDDYIAWASPATFLLLWWKMMYYGQAFQNTGPLVIIIFQVLSDISFFLMLLLANFSGFTFAFHILFAGDRREICNSAEIGTEEGTNFCDAFGGWDRTLATVFVMMLGQFDLEPFFTSSHSAVAVSFLVIYLLLSAVLMLNLLIAIIGDSFDRVKRHETAHFLMGRARVIHDMESSLWSYQRRALRKKIGRYLYVLVPESQYATKSKHMWQGKIAEMEKVLREQTHQIDSKLQEMDEKLQDVDSKVECIKRSVTALVDSQTTAVNQ